jgi:hypothetical protein
LSFLWFSYQRSLGIGLKQDEQFDVVAETGDGLEAIDQFIEHLMAETYPNQPVSLRAEEKRLEGEYRKRGKEGWR